MKQINKEKLLKFYDNYFTLNKGNYWNMSLESDKNLK